MFYIPYYSMDWDVIFHQAFESEFGELPEPVQDEPLAHARVALDVWTSTKAAARGHAQWVQACEHEGTSFRSRQRGLARGIRL